MSKAFFFDIEKFNAKVEKKHQKFFFQKKWKILNLLNKNATATNKPSKTMLLPISSQIKKSFEKYFLEKKLWNFEKFQMDIFKNLPFSCRSQILKYHNFFSRIDFLKLLALIDCKSFRAFLERVYLEKSHFYSSSYDVFTFFSEFAQPPDFEKIRKL